MAKSYDFEFPSALAEAWGRRVGEVPQRQHVDLVKLVKLVPIPVDLALLESDRELQSLVRLTVALCLGVQYAAIEKVSIKKMLVVLAMMSSVNRAGVAERAAKASSRLASGDSNRLVTHDEAADAMESLRVDTDVLRKATAESLRQGEEKIQGLRSEAGQAFADLHRGAQSTRRHMTEAESRQTRMEEMMQGFVQQQQSVMARLEGEIETLKAGMGRPQVVPQGPPPVRTDQDSMMSSITAAIQQAATKPQVTEGFPPSMVVGSKVTDGGSRGIVVCVAPADVTIAVLHNDSGLWRLTPEEFRAGGWSVQHWNPEIAASHAPVEDIARNAELWLGYAERDDVCRSLLRRAIVERYSGGSGAVASEVVKRLANAVERAVLGGTEGAIAALHQMMEWQLLRTENGPRGAEAYYETLDAARDTPSTAQARKAAQKVSKGHRVGATHKGPPAAPPRAYVPSSKNGQLGRGK